MPYGLVNAPSVFQGFMHEVLREFLHQFVIVYIDDILIYSRSLAEHRQHVAEVLQRLREFQLYLKAEKCTFHQSTVHFLGYIINSGGIRMDKGKVEAITSWPIPSSIKELQRFLWFSNFYCRFISNYSTITSPLTDLLKGKTKALAWTPNATEAFNMLKHTFTSAPLLVHPSPKLPFWSPHPSPKLEEVDASTTGVGAVLSQQQGTPPKLHPCAFFSRKLSPVERNYDIGNRKLLAIKLALEEWRHWLEGAAHPFLVLTDHKNLQYLREAKRLNPRQARWALSLPVSNLRFLTVLVQEMLRQMPCPRYTPLRGTRGNQKEYCQRRSLPVPSSGPHHQSPLPLLQPIRRAVHLITSMFLGLNAHPSSIPLTLS